MGTFPLAGLVNMGSSPRAPPTAADSGPSHVHEVTLKAENIT